ncbi:MAG TPA: protein translocase subunit SecD, partial [Luteimonas sp.]|nr:protein translocase subunit SecD [Luteimonas sp.]
MLAYSRSKYVIALLVLLLSALYSLPNLYPQDPSVQITANRGAKIDAAFRQRVDASLKAAGVVPKKVEVQNGGELLVRLKTPDAQIRASDVLRDAVGSNYVVALNLASTVPNWLRAIGARPMLLGLDLQGGVHFLMQVDQNAALQKRFESYADDLRVMLRENRVRYESVERRQDNAIVVTLAPGESTATAQGLIAKNMPTLANDVSGSTITVRVPDSEIEKITADAIERNVGTLRNRINELGVAEPLIQRQGNDRVVVELPGVQDTAQAKRILGATATLEYRGVVDGNAYEAIANGNVPPEARVYYRKELGPDGKPIPILLNKRVIASGEQLVDAKSGYDSQSGTPMVSITLNGVGGQRMFDYTSQNVGKQMAVVYIERIPEVKVVDGKEVKTIRTSEQVINAA